MLCRFYWFRSLAKPTWKGDISRSATDKQKEGVFGELLAPYNLKERHSRILVWRMVYIFIFGTVHIKFMSSLISPFRQKSLLWYYTDIVRFSPKNTINILIFGKQIYKLFYKLVHWIKTVIITCYVNWNVRARGCLNPFLCFPLSIEWFSF